MAKREQETARFLQTLVTAVVRSEDEKTGLKTAEACAAGGLTSLEITFTTPGAASIIRSLQANSDPSIMVGAGSILSKEEAERAIQAGAEYIVGPNFDEEIAALTIAEEIPYFPGCMTINEMIHATKNGASIIKLFPGNHFGPGFIKAVRDPAPHLQIMPTGGVDLENMDDWFQAGAAAVGIGSALNKPAAKGKFDEVKELAAKFSEYRN
ncbi:bifunctional 4-hydroxy-2-oxoglutarate aldolase/2-dehydro-3-deoxy-phosphogluconate aldolase [Bacillus daqingensis]|uniref:Bifunctional 4-hydroxy-2-oxoglutarate aldolase/2-dehydro-3-deoxy-phosphogluconate aldolase n=1 Tax=Bacillus daqingensis TaxID=872396 RepID=A0ABV9NSS5_9BACI